MPSNNVNENQPTNLLEDELLDSLAMENEFVRYKIEKGDQSVKGDNYLGSVKSFNIVGVDKKNEKKSLDIVVKAASKSVNLRTQIDLDAIYKREAYTYTTLFPTFHKMELKKGLTQTFIGPKYYKVYMEDRNELIVMENLKKIGYKMYDRTKNVDEEHIKLVLKHYAKLHALSFALRDQDTNTYQNIIKPLQLNELFIYTFRRSGLIETFKNHLEEALKCLDQDVDKLAYKVFEEFTKNLENTICEIEKLTDNDSVILHGDNWINNMLFKYDNSDNTTKPTNVRFVDFQFTRVGPPPIDLSYFFYCTCDKNSLDKLEDLLEFYYNALSFYLTELGSDSENVYPYAVLKQQWKKYAKFGLILSISLIRIMLSGPDEVKDLTEWAELNKIIGQAFIYEIEKIDLYYKRIKPIILHFVDNDFI